MAKKVTMDIIAKKLNISKNTVSLALRDMPGISEPTRRMIFDMANNLGYHYKSSNKAIPFRNLCLVMSKSIRDSIEFFTYIQLGIEEEARKNNINTIIHYYDESIEVFDTPNCIKDGMVSGIVTLGRVARKVINNLTIYNLPIVMVDNYFDDILMDSILTDNQCGGYVASEYLIKCGHRRIGFIGDISASVSFYDRYQGYKKALVSRKVELNSTFSIIDRSLESLNIEEIEEVFNKIKGRVGLPTAYLCCNDAEAVIAIKVLKNMGIAVPEEISIMGFDDIDTAKNITPELTTMYVQKELMGKKAVKRLIGKINGEEATIEKILIAASLVERKSVKQM